MTLDLDAIAASITAPDATAYQDALDRQTRLTKPTGALGRLEGVSAWIASVQGACPPREFSSPAVIVFAGDHGIARNGVSAYPPEVTAQMVANFVAGGAAVNVLARQVGARVRVLDLSVDADLATIAAIPADVTAYKVRRSTGVIGREPAMSLNEAEQAFRAGMAVVDEEVDRGTDLLITGDMGIGNTTPSATLVALLTSSEVSEVVGRGTGIDDSAWMVKCAAVRDAARRGRALKGTPIPLLAEVSGPDLAAMTGFLVQAAVRRTPVMLDGVVSAACALVAHRISHHAAEWWIASHRSTEPAQSRALERLSLEPLLDLQLRLGEGTGALIALPLLNAAAATLRDMATFEQAGVSDRDESS
jgi:nicotinate-nucleotide--dimethylbenzimidazole phosphoribosyltransferase